MGAPLYAAPSHGVEPADPRTQVLRRPTGWICRASVCDVQPARATATCRSAGRRRPGRGSRPWGRGRTTCPDAVPNGACRRVASGPRRTVARQPRRTRQATLPAAAPARVGFSAWFMSGTIAESIKGLSSPTPQTRSITFIWSGQHRATVIGRGARRRADRLTTGRAASDGRRRAVSCPRRCRGTANSGPVPGPLESKGSSLRCVGRIVLSKPTGAGADVGPFALLDDHLDRAAVGKSQVGDGEERAAAVTRVPWSPARVEGAT